MATQESMAIRCDSAITEIEAVFSELLGADVQTLPRTHRDREMLRVIQLEQIAKWAKELHEAEGFNDKDATLAFAERMAELAPSPLHPKNQKRDRR